MRLIALSLLLLAGCVSSAEREQREAQEQAARNAAYTSSVMQQCENYGFSKGTPEFRECLMRIDQANQQQREAQRQMLLQQYIYQQGIFRPR